MGSSRERGFSVTPERLAFIEQKMREMGIESGAALATAANLSPDVIYKKLFSGKNVDRSTVEAIAKTLKIQPTEIIEPERWYRRSKTAKSQASTNIDWHYVCRTMLDRQKKLSTNEVIASEAMQFDLLDDEIFISLALVERKEPERLSQNVHPARPIEQYEEKPPIEYEQFREQILGQGKSDRIAIVGEPGAGKTTLLQHIAFWILDKELGLPIWISLGDLIKNGDLQRLKEYLTQVWLDDAMSNVTQDVKSDFLKQLNEQRVWLLLDGVDEIVVSSGIALREINSQLRGWLSQSCIILTCRINVWEVDINALRDFPTYRTKEFHYPTQVEQFIESGFRKSNQQSGERLKTELANTERTRLQQLVRNPLRLMMLCTTWHEQESLPATKAELYKRFVSEFYQWNRSKWKKKDLNYAFFPNTVAKQEKLNKALGRLACRALDEESSPFRLPHNLVSDELGDPDEDGSDFWLALNLGWLQVARDSDKPSDKVYTFFHPTFQEYFAACAIDDWRYFLNHDNQNPNPLLNPNPSLEYDNGKPAYRIFEPQWKEVILLWLGRPHKEVAKVQKEKFIKSLVEYEDGCGGFYGTRAYFLATLGIAEFGDCSLADTVVEQTVKYYLGFFDDKQQTWRTYRDPLPWLAQEVLLETDPNKVIKSIAQKIIKTIANVTKYSPEIQNAAIKSAEILGLLGTDNSGAIKALIQLITNDNPDFVLVQSRAAKSLVKIATGNKEAINSLMQLLQIIQNKRVKITVASTLGKIEFGNHPARNCLIALMNPSHHPETRLRAAWVLLDIDPGSPIAISTLKELRDTQDKYISQQASMVLEKGTVITDEYKEPDDYSPEEIRAAQECWNNSNSVFELLEADKPELARREAIWLILEEVASNYAEAVSAMVEQLNICRDTFALELIIEILGKVAIGDETVVKHLIQFLQANSPLLAVTPRTLTKILQGELFFVAVVGLKNYLQTENYERNPFRYEQIYQVIWHCAQNMPYQIFYQAWQPDNKS